jgi:hypothetical protein
LYVGPQELGVNGFSVDEGGKDMEVIIGDMQPDENCSIDCSQGNHD